MSNLALSAAKLHAREHMTGIWAAIPYPFTPSGELDERGLRHDVDYYCKTLMLDGIFCGGLIGECWSLTLEERERAQAIVLSQISGQTKVIAQTGCSSIRDTVRLTTHAQRHGASYAVIMNPPMNPQDAETTINFMHAVCSSTDLGVALFNTSFSGYALDPETIATLADIPNIVAVKDAQPIEHIAATRKAVAGRILVCDNRETRLLHNMIAHGDHVHMSSFSPLLVQWSGHLAVRDYFCRAEAGDLDGAKAISSSLEPIREIQQRWIWDYTLSKKVPIAAIKYWSELLGMTGGNPRPPLQPLSHDEKSALRRELAGAREAIDARV
jgi:4-hydroxy-tetrahydrodipicolinate synthase